MKELAKEVCTFYNNLNSTNFLYYLWNLNSTKFIDGKLFLLVNCTFYNNLFTWNLNFLL